MKAEWQTILDKAKRGSGLASGKQPKWYKILNLVFTATYEDLEITGNSADISFSLNEGDDESDISEEESSQECDSSGVNNEDVPGDEETTCSSKGKTKLVVAIKNVGLFDQKISFESYGKWYGRFTFIANKAR